MAVEVGTAYVAVIPSARGFAKALRQAIGRELAGSDLDKLVAGELSNVGPIRLPVTPVLDRDRLPDTLTPTRPVTLPVTPELHAGGLRGEVQREVDAAARSTKVRVDVEPKVDRSRFAGLLASGISGAVSQLASGAQSVAGMASSMVSSISGIVVSLAGLAAAASFSVPAVYLLGGALGSLPAIATGAAAAIATLAIGFMGIGEAFESAGASGGGAGVNLAAQARQVAQATRGVEAAERSLARAQREVVDAQLAVTRARKAEQERLEDLDRAVRGARLGEEEAALRVVEAEQELAEARKGRDQTEITRAELAYQRALLGVEDAKDATEDLTAEQAESARVGVEGSDQVQAALKRQRDAVEAVTAAQEGLLSAQESLAAAMEKPGGGGGGVAKELTKLAPSAANFVRHIKALKPAFEDLRLNVQQRLFAGLGVTVRHLANAWFPQLNKTLGSYADTFNGLAKRMASSLSQKSFIDNMAAGAESARKALQRIGESVSGPLVDAFGRLSKAAGPFVERLGDEVAKLVEDFSAWITKLDKSGELDKFFERAAEIFGDLVDMGRDVASIFGSVMKILFGEEDTTNSPWEGAKKGLDSLAAWFRDPENQQKIRDFITDLKDAAVKVGEASDEIAGWVDRVSEWVNRISGVGDALSGGWDDIQATAQARWDQIVDYVRGIPGRVGEALAALPGQARQRIVEMAGQVGEALGHMIGATVNTLAGLPGRARTALAALPGQVRAMFAQAGTSSRTALNQFVNGALSLLRGLPGRARDALVNIGSTLVRAGRELIRGLTRGIREEIPSLDGLLAWITNKIPEWKGPPARDEQLLAPAGRLIMSGLSAGISDGVPALRRQLGDVTDVVSGVTADLDASASAGSWRSGADAPAAMSVAFVGGAEDAFMRWVRENIRVDFGGSVDAALGS